MFFLYALLFYAIFTVGAHLQNIRSALGGIGIPVNSGYRNPVHNLNHIVPSGASNSRHIYGDGAVLRVMDFDNDGNVENGTAGQDTIILRNAAVAAGATFTRTHVHMDWG